MTRAVLRSVILAAAIGAVAGPAQSQGQAVAASAPAGWPRTGAWTRARAKPRPHARPRRPSRPRPRDNPMLRRGARPGRRSSGRPSRSASPNLNASASRNTRPSLRAGTTRTTGKGSRSSLAIGRSGVAGSEAIGLQRDATGTGRVPRAAGHLRARAIGVGRRDGASRRGGVGPEGDGVRRLSSLAAPTPFDVAPYVSAARSEPAAIVSLTSRRSPTTRAARLPAAPGPAAHRGVYVDGALAGTVDDSAAAARACCRRDPPGGNLARGFVTLTFDVRVPANDTVTFTRELDPLDRDARPGGGAGRDSAQGDVHRPRATSGIVRRS